MLPILALFVFLQHYYNRQQERLCVTEFGRRLHARLPPFDISGAQDNKSLLRCLMAYKRRISYTRLLSRGILEDLRGELYTEHFEFEHIPQPLLHVNYVHNGWTKNFFTRLIFTNRWTDVQYPDFTYPRRYTISEQGRQMILEMLDDATINRHLAMINPDSTPDDNLDFIKVLINKFIRIRDNYPIGNRHVDAMDAFVMMVWMSQFAMVINDRRIIRLRIPNIILVLYLFEAIMKNNTALQGLKFEIRRRFRYDSIYDISVDHDRYWRAHDFSAMRTRLLADLAANEI